MSKQASTKRLLPAWLIGTAGLLSVLVGLAGADGALEVIARTTGRDDHFWNDALSALDWITGKEITNFLLGGLLVMLALIVNLARRRPILSGPVLYVGLVQLLTTTVADFAKPPFGRLRPFQAAAEARWSELWFMGPDFGSFPSGHVAFYAGLFVPLAILLPRWMAPLLALPLLIAAERVFSHDHYLSDVGASLMLSALISAVAWRLLGVDRILAPSGARTLREPGDVAETGEPAATGRVGAGK